MNLNLPNEKINLSFQFGNTEFYIDQLSFGTYRCSIGKHCHAKNYYELHLLTNGEGTLITPFGSTGLSKGMLYMTGCGLEHQQINNNSFPMQEYCIGFESKKEKKGEHPSWLERFLKIELEIASDSKESCLHYFESIESEVMSKKAGYMEMVKNLIISIFIEFIRCIDADAKEKNDDSPHIEKRSYIIDSCMLFEYQSITESELAKTLNLSVRQLQRYLKDTYGQGFLQMRTKARLNKAKEFLQEGKEISQVANLVGFESVNYLKRLLKLE